MVMWQEIDEMLSGLISAEDEEEIMKELDDLREQEVKNLFKKGNIAQIKLISFIQLDAELPSVPSNKLPQAVPDHIPDVPTHIPSSKTEDKQGKTYILYYLM